MVVSTVPDSGAVVQRLTDAAVIRFDEVISEQSGGGLDRLVQLSPRGDQLTVRWKRAAIEVEPEGGWRDSVVYHLTLLPGVTDLRNNRMETGRRVIFSTGIPIPDAQISGTVLNWEAGRPARNALVEAVLLPDSLAYLGSTDAEGEFTLAAVPPGAYVVSAVVDGNNNQRREPREAFDSVTVQLETTASHVFWTFTHDSVGPRLRRAVALDSLTARVEFTQSLAPDLPDTGAVRAWALPDTIPIRVATVWRPATYDSIAAAGAAARDTAGPAPPDTAAAGRAAPRAPPPRLPAQQVADTSRAARLLAQRPSLSDALIVRFAERLVPGGRYLIAAMARNVGGAVAESETTLAVPEPRSPP